MANVQLAVAGDETTQVILSVPGVQGPAGSNLPPSGTTHQLLYKQSNTNYDTAWKLLTNDNVDAAAAIAGTKISPNFGSQNVLTTGTSTAASFVPTSSGVPTNGLYLPSANNVALSTNGTGRLFVDASGNVGIAESSPSSHSAGSGVPTLVLKGSSATFPARSGAIALLSQDTTTAKTWIYHDTDLYIQNTTATNIRFLTNNAERLRITSAGLVGIGTSAPGALFSLAGSSAYTVGNSGLATQGLDINATAGGSGLFGGALSFGVGGTGRASISAFQGTTDSDVVGLAFNVHTSGTAAADAVEAMRITQGGLVGIGTSSPSSTNGGLDIASGGLSLVLGADGSASTRTNVTNKQARIGAYHYTNAEEPVGVATVFSTASSNAIYFGGGTASVNAATSLEFYTAANTTTTTGTQRMVIDSSGRVGIGTTSPVNPLHVVGTVRIADPTGGQLLLEDSDEADGNRPFQRIVSDSGSLVFSNANRSGTGTTNSVERARIDSSGRLLVGTASARTLASYGSAGLQVESTAFATASISAVNNQNTADGVALMLGKSRGAAVGSFTIVQSGDQIGGIYFQGADGAAMRNGASVVAAVDASPAYASTALVTGQTYRIVTVTSSDWSAIGGPNPASVGNVFTATGPSVTSLGTAILNAGNMPGRLVFSTTADGSVSPTERLRITSAGLVGVGTSSPVVDLDVAPAASTATFRIHARSNTTPVAAIELVRGTNTTFGADGNGDYRIKNDAGNLSFEYGDSGVTNERLRITSAGLVGIGTSSASSTLDVFGPANGLQAEFNGSIDGRGLAISTAVINGVNNGLVNFNARGAGADGTFTFSTDGNERARIDSSGRLGIGTSAPNTRLSVVGTATGLVNGAIRTNTTAATQSANSGLWLCGNQSTSHYNWLIASQFNVGGALEITPSTAVDGATFTTPTAVFTQTGRVGIGTTSPTSAQLYVNSSETYGVRINHATLPLQSFLVNGTQAFSIGANSGGGGSFYYGTGNLTAATIDSSGRLLVGTGSDSGGALLQVNGDRIRVATAKTPASATATGTAGEICWDANYIYVCTATNTWKRTAIATW